MPDCSGFGCLHELGPPASRPTKWLFLADGHSIVSVAGRTARFDRLPGGCRAVRLHDAIGLELLRCEREEGQDLVYARGADGVWREEGLVRGAPPPYESVASDGTVLLGACRGGCVTSVRSPVPAGTPGAWRRLDLPGAAAARAMPGGAVLAVIPGARDKVSLAIHRADGAVEATTVPLPESGPVISVDVDGSDPIVTIGTVAPGDAYAPALGEVRAARYRWDGAWERIADTSASFGPPPEFAACFAVPEGEPDEYVENLLATVAAVHDDGTLPDDCHGPLMLGALDVPFAGWWLDLADGRGRHWAVAFSILGTRPVARVGDAVVLRGHWVQYEYALPEGVVTLSDEAGHTYAAVVGSPNKVDFESPHWTPHLDAAWTREVLAAEGGVSCQWKRWSLAWADPNGEIVVPEGSGARVGDRYVVNAQSTSVHGGSGPWCGSTLVGVAAIRHP